MYALIINGSSHQAKVQEEKQSINIEINCLLKMPLPKTTHLRIRPIDCGGLYVVLCGSIFKLNIQPMLVVEYYCSVVA